ncbi:MAG: ribonuclease HI [Deltaproteobacteria bacterium]|nr:ribonuclease HI [Deltaproteobacteria bacterium]
MRFKNNKVWVAADAEGRPLEIGGRALIKYQLDQPQDYRVGTENLRRLAEVAAAPRAPAAKVPRRPAAAVTDRPEEGVVHIYTDGASSGNPGPSGIGVVLIYGSQRKEIGEYIGEATNNIAELLAIQKGLAAVKKKNLPVRVYTDSSYAHGVLTRNWKAKKNQELIAAIRKDMAAFRDLRLVKVEGHKGVVENDRADRLAVAATKEAL